MPSCRILHFTRDLLLLSLTVSTLGQAQQQHFLSLEAGPSVYDLSRTGTAPATSLAVGFAIAGPFRVVPGLTWFSYDPGSGQKDSYVFPEISVNWAGEWEHFRPTLGSVEGEPTRWEDHSLIFMPRRFTPRLALTFR
jgi:hypothetical protein